MVFKEADNCINVYIVLDGEFEIIKRIRPPEKEESQAIDKYLGQSPIKIDEE